MKTGTVEGNAQRRMPTLAEASESVLTNLPLLICGFALTLTLIHDWII